MWRSRTPFRRLKAQRGGVLVWLPLLLLVLIGTVIGALIVFVYVVENVHAKLLVTDSPVQLQLLDPLDVRATVRNALDIVIDERIATRVPVDTALDVPIEETLQLQVSVDTMVPVSTSVFVDDVIPLSQEVAIDTVVEADLLGETFELPLRGTFPVTAQVPVKLEVPIRQRVRVQFDALVPAKLKQNLAVPLQTTIDATVPLRARMTVPVLNDLQAQVTVDREPPLDVNLDYADLEIELDQIGIGLEGVDELDWIPGLPELIERLGLRHASDQPGHAPDYEPGHEPGHELGHDADGAGT